VDAILLDSRTTDRLGCSGQSHDWCVSRQVVESSPVPVILAGGLTPANVELAVQSVRPYGVDVNSGVEHPSGDKSAARCKDFVIRASNITEQRGEPAESHNPSGLTDERKP
jgi:phosphoribosylanthranilate isomerase